MADHAWDGFGFCPKCLLRVNEGDPEPGSCPEDNGKALAMRAKAQLRHVLKSGKMKRPKWLRGIGLTEDDRGFCVLVNVVDKAAQDLVTKAVLDATLSGAITVVGIRFLAKVVGDIVALKKPRYKPPKRPEVLSLCVEGGKPWRDANKLLKRYGLALRWSGKGCGGDQVKLRVEPISSMTFTRDLP